MKLALCVIPLMIGILQHAWGNIIYLQDSLCNGVFKIPYQATTLKSQSGATYAVGRDCILVVRPYLSSARVRIAFLDFELTSSPECADKLLFYDGASAQGDPFKELCASSEDMPEPVMSTGSSMTIRFVTGSGTPSRGFTLVLSNLWLTWFMQDEKCGTVQRPATITLPPLLHGTLLSQREATYEPNTDCIVVIKAFLPTQRVRLKLFEFILPDDYCQDFLYIYDGDISDGLLQTHCGKDTEEYYPPAAVSSGDKVTVWFKTGDADPMSGFNLDLSNVFRQKCYVCGPEDRCPAKDYLQQVPPSHRRTASTCYACMKAWERASNRTARSCAETKTTLLSILEHFGTVGDSGRVVEEFNGCRKLTRLDDNEEVELCICKDDFCNVSPWHGPRPWKYVVLYVIAFYFNI